MDIPAGRIHRSALIERGWSALMVDVHLTDVVKVEGAPLGVSNKCYLRAEVDRVEREVAEVRKAVGARADLIPSRGDYTREGTLSRQSLIRRGWTARHISRYLGGPDWVDEELLTDQPAYRYGRDRVEEAEARDQKLAARVEEADAGRAEEKVGSIAQAMRGGQLIWRHWGGQWLVQGRDLTPGQVVGVTSKDGRQEQRQVVRIVEVTADGTAIAEVRRPTTRHGDTPLTAAAPTAAAPPATAGPPAVGSPARSQWVLVAGPPHRGSDAPPPGPADHPHRGGVPPHHQRRRPLRVGQSPPGTRGGTGHPRDLLPGNLRGSSDV